MNRNEGVGRVLQREGGCGRREDGVGDERRERGTEEGMKGETKGGRKGGYYKGSIYRWVEG